MASPTRGQAEGTGCSRGPALPALVREGLPRESLLEGSPSASCAEGGASYPAGATPGTGSLSGWMLPGCLHVPPHGSDTYPLLQDGDKFWRMPECYIRGSTIKYLRIPDEIIDMVKEEVVAKGRGRGGLQQQKQQKGRGMGGAGRGRPFSPPSPLAGSRGLPAGA